MNDRNQQVTGWQIERSASEAYEQFLVPAIFDAWTERLLDHVDIQAGDDVLDVACGTGVVARESARRVGESGSVVGIDVNDGMLAVADEVAAEDQLAIEWRHGDALDLPFDDGRFDVVCCQQALQFVDEPIVALDEMRRVLSPDGRAVLSVWRPIGHQPAYDVLADALERHVGDDAGAMMRSPFPAWDVAHLHAIAQAAGWSGVEITIDIGSMRYPSTNEFVRREVASSPLAAQLATIDTGARDALLRDVNGLLDGYEDDRGVTTPMEAFVARLDNATSDMPSA